MTYSVINEHGKFMQGDVYSKAIDAVEKEKTSYDVKDITIHILDVTIIDVDRSVILVKVGC